MSVCSACGCARWRAVALTAAHSARKAEEAQEALAKAAAAEAAKNKPTSPRAKPPPRRAAGGAAAKPVVSKSRKRARDSGADDDDADAAPAARATKPRLKKVKVERTGPLRRSTREGIKKKKGFYSQRAMELEAWKGTGTKDDPYDAR